MNRPPFSLRFVGAAASGEEDLSQLFNPIVRAHYANNMVFAPPVDRQAEMQRAIEALRASEKEVVDHTKAPEAVPAAHG